MLFWATPCIRIHGLRFRDSAMSTISLALWGGAFFIEWFILLEDGETVHNAFLLCSPYIKRLSQVAS